MLKDFFKLSLRNLRRRGLRSWLTLLGIIIGVAAVVSLISLGGGLKAAVNSQFGVSSTDLITIQAGGISGYGPPGAFAVNPLTEDDAEAIGRLSTIKIAIPRIIETMKTEFNNKIQISAIGSIPEEYAEEIYELQDIKAESGRLIYQGDSGKIALGNNFASSGNDFGKALAPGNNLDIKGKKFRVVGIMKKKGSFILDNVVLMMENDLKDLINDSNKVDIIIAQVKDKNLMAKAQDEIEDLLRNRRDVKKGQEDFEVSTPEATLATVNKILGGVQAFFAVIAFISIIVGSLGIINTMTTSVLERKKEIGIMKAIGARNSDIFIQFFIEAGLVGLIGGIIGVFIGVDIGLLGTIGINKYIGAETPLKINFVLVFSALAGSFIIGCVSGILPAIKAAKQKPVEALRE